MGVVGIAFYFLHLQLGGEQMNIQAQTHKTLQEIGIPITTFCKRMKISTAAYYRWQHNDLKLSTKTEERIKKYVNKLSEVF